ncbi:uncharacterized protein B0I36DRAFT_312459 [Microdochium trichocladiopsis]|uniref:Adenosine deaminase domain-containing protein n=1 Tax=Microdochium trichocladiopsis TaxID=1682393 RepID=A0A9P8YLM7_9PEZI|nr:uncharacterized protein B0I36DRAFT_312459 [Microdochium trichocladiopsis]KAH7041260.1 hypothetical protein B0I36DRAFT_312459 [Microdochium trichocladiopsis]
MATTTTGDDVLDFRAMPKIELHAHLTGSITRRCLHEIWRDKRAKGEAEDLEDPLVVMPEGRHDHDLTSFFPLFSSYIYRLINDLPSLRRSTKQVVHDFAADGVVYLELRTTPRGIPAAGLDKAGYVRAVLEAIAEAESEGAAAASAGGDGGGGEGGATTTTTTTRGSGIRVRLILSVDRRNSVDEAWEVLNLARTFMAGGEGAGGEKAGGVVGLDLCGDTAARCGQIAMFTPVMHAAREAGLQLTIHFAEAASTGTDEELQTILDWRPSRLGHVIHVPDRIKEQLIAYGRGGGEGEGEGEGGRRGQPIGLELCLSSNVQLKMIVGSFDVHHFGEWWRVQNGPVIMPCTDDVGVFESPLSNEWRLVQQYFELTRDDITLLGRKTIDVIFGGEADKERLREIMW